MARVLGQTVDAVPASGYICNPALRFEDECARHKLLDLIGDLRLCGGFLKAKVEAYKPGHALNTAAAREIMNKLK